MVHAKRFLDDLEHGLLRVEGLVRVLEDQVEPSSQCPHLDSHEASARLANAAYDPRDPAGGCRGKDLSDEHPQRVAPPRNRPRFIRIEASRTRLNHGDQRARKHWSAVEAPGPE